jgi:Zn-dependent peptidase ImmA (M78 family)
MVARPATLQFLDILTDITHNINGAMFHARPGARWTQARLRYHGRLDTHVHPDRQMGLTLRDIIDSTKLDPAFCAELVGVATDQFQEWLTGTPIPRFVIPELSSILGVPEKTLVSCGSGMARAQDSGAIAPAVWYKLRNERLTTCDREMVGLVRKLGYYIDQLQCIRSSRVRRFEVLFKTIRGEVDRTQPPTLQGRAAAVAFRSTADLAHGQQGIGEWVRPTLRRLGVLVVESPINSDVEGCSFMVGTEASQTPCVFANSYRSTWFRRNAVILHELAHAILDLENDQVAVDFKDGSKQAEFSELRAQVFAQECLVPRSLLVHVANHFGLKWSELTAEDVAHIVAHSHAEQELVLKAAFEHELIDAEELERYRHYECDALVRRLSTHALTTREFLRTYAAESPKWVAENRNTSVGRRPLRLPSAYVGEVIGAFRCGEISLGKAAEMLMMEEDTFRDRFCADSQLVG